MNDPQEQRAIAQLIEDRLAARRVEQALASAAAQPTQHRRINGVIGVPVCRATAAELRQLIADADRRAGR